MRHLALLLSCALAGCARHETASAPQHLDLPSYPGAPKSGKRAEPSREQPPASRDAKSSPFPTVHEHPLRNGLTAKIVEARALPVVQVRVVIRAGMGYAPKDPALAELTATMLKDGGTRSMTSAELLQRIEGLGADLSVNVGLDATTVSTAVTKERLREALAIVGEVVQSPRFDERELGKLRARAEGEAEDKLRANGQFTAMHQLMSELFDPGSPYHAYGMVPSEIAKVDAAKIREFHRRFYVPKNMSVILVGDVAEADAAAQIAKVFGGLAGGEPPALDFPAPKIPTGRRVIVVHRPKSAQSDVFVAGISIARRDEAWPAARVCNQVLGGGVAGRLFLDVREQRSLAYSAYSRVVELAHGAQPIVAYAGTQTPKTVDAVRGLLDNLQRVVDGGVSEPEVDTARRYLSDVFAIRMETIGAIADMVSELSTLGFANDYWDRYREAVRAVPASAASRIAPKLFQPDRALIVVAGDADLIASPLGAFGPVAVVDPERDFSEIHKTSGGHFE